MYRCHACICILEYSANYFNFMQSGGDPLVLCFVDFVSPAHAATAMDALQGKLNVYIIAAMSHNVCNVSIFVYDVPFLLHAVGYLNCATIHCSALFYSDRTKQAMIIIISMF